MSALYDCVNVHQMGRYDSAIRMRPSELIKHAEPRDDPYAQRHIGRLAESISRRGYRATQNADSPIHLAYGADGETFLLNGNHRVHAMVQAGYDKPVPVKVTDLRRRTEGNR